jgi:hypothetical protein
MVIEYDQQDGRPTFSTTNMIHAYKIELHHTQGPENFFIDSGNSLSAKRLWAYLGMLIHIMHSFYLWLVRLIMLWAEVQFLAGKTFLSSSVQTVQTDCMWLWH